MLNHVHKSVALMSHVNCPANTFAAQISVDPSPADAISAIKFSPYPDSAKLAAASWDKHVYLYEYIADTSGSSECRQLAKFESRAPVLDVCFGENDDKLYIAGLDWEVRKYGETSKTLRLV